MSIRNLTAEERSRLNELERRLQREENSMTAQLQGSWRPELCEIRLELDDVDTHAPQLILQCGDVDPRVTILRLKRDNSIEKLYEELDITPGLMGELEDFLRQVAEFHGGRRRSNRRKTRGTRRTRRRSTRRHRK